MKEILIDNKEIVLRAYTLVVFIAPWFISMLWQFRYMNGLREKMGPKFWLTMFPNKEATNLVRESNILLKLQRKRNLWFIATLGIWLVGAILFVVLLAWLNGKL